jgi:hypothetical protein
MPTPELDPEVYNLTLECLSNREWRLNNLYWIVDKWGRKVKFKMNKTQRFLFNHPHYIEFILKSRQRGVTTFKAIDLLDRALFGENVTCGFICHTLPAAKRIFKDKIKFAYKNLPEEIKNSVRITSDSDMTLTFSNDSSYYVATSFRGGTLNYLHISEFGYICAYAPNKADEIVSGAFNAVNPGNHITVESTAKGKAGHFHDFIMQAKALREQKKKLTYLDGKLFFFAWWDDDDCVLDPTDVIITTEKEEYFAGVEAEFNMIIDAPHRAFYVKKEAQQHDLMFSEYPSSIEEAFKGSTDGAYYFKQFVEIHRTGRIAAVPYDPNNLVDTSWDVGLDDYTVIWFIQRVGAEVHVIDFYFNHDEDYSHYVDILNGKPWARRYGRHIVPHDIKQRTMTAHDKLSKLQILRSLGVSGLVGIPRWSKENSILQVRQTLPVCLFDETTCEKGIEFLKNYRKKWDRQMAQWKDEPYDDENSHAADAFALFCIDYQMRVLRKGGFDKRTMKSITPATPPPVGGWT